VHPGPIRCLSHIFAATGNGAQTSGAFIASKASALYDVTVGTNGTCAVGALLCKSATGWDGPTGYGTPNASALVPGGGTGPGATDGSQEVTGGCSIGGGVLLGLAMLGLRRRR
jgi:hypothetical protein